MELIDKLGLVYIRDKRILLTRSKNKDVFYIPGGKRESGESDQQVLVREIREELGVELVPETLRHLETFVAQAHGKAEGVKVQATCYTGEFTREPKPNGEIEEIAWLAYADRSRVGNVAQILFDWLKERNLID